MKEGLERVDESKFNILTEAYNRLVETQNALKEVAQKIEVDFKDPAELYSFINPIGYKTDLDEMVRDARRIFTSFVVSQVNKGYKNLRIEDKDIQKFVEERQNFNTGEVIKHIREVYADEDGITLKQIRETCKTLLPWGDFGGKRCVAYMPEHILWINETGIELRIHGYEYDQAEKASALIKLVDIVLRGAKPSQAKGQKVRIGEVYRDDRIKSLRYFKNNTLKVLFHSAEDAEKVKAALVRTEA